MTYNLVLFSLIKLYIIINTWNLYIFFQRWFTDIEFLPQTINRLKWSARPQNPTEYYFFLENSVLNRQYLVKWSTTCRSILYTFVQIERTKNLARVEQTNKQKKLRQTEG
jgi:hypothetical protein